METAISTLLALLGICYAFMMISILIGNLLAKNKRDKRYEYEPAVSILIAAKDEEENIAACLESTLAQNYPIEKLQIVVVNDRSTDNTQAIIEYYLQKAENLVSVTINEEPIWQTGKLSALKEGIKYCQGELILFTDADCVADPLWTKKIVSNFGQKDSDVGLVMGFSVPQKRGSEASLFAKLQAFDLSFLLNIAAGCVGLGKPASCIGNNVACRIEVLDDIGGFEALGYTLTEDAALMQAITRKTSWKVVCSYEPESVIVTKPALNLRQFYRQRARWLSGGQKACKWAIIPLQFVFLFHLLILTFTMISVTGLNFSPGLIICVALKFSSDLALSYMILKRLRRTELLKFFLAYEAFLMFYTSFVGLGSLFTRRVKWKGEILKAESGRRS